MYLLLAAHDSINKRNHIGNRHDSIKIHIGSSRDNR